MVSAVLLDIDGVLTTSWQALPGAVQTIDWLKEHGIDFRLVTNTSSRTRREIVGLLADSGMAVDSSQVVTAVTSAARYLGENHPGSGCLVLNEGGDLSEDLEGVSEGEAATADVVLLGGAGPSIGYDELNMVFRRALDGVPVVALHRNTRYQTDDGPVLDMGAFVVGLEEAADMEVTVVGKPAADFFATALRDLHAEARDVVMVGDDIVSDVLGAQATGMTGVLVRTGKFRPSDLDRDDSPDHVIDNIGQLPALLRRLETGPR